MIRSRNLRQFPTVKKIGQGVLNLVFPPHCYACDEPMQESTAGVTLCDDCYGEIEWIEGPTCKRCGAPEQLTVGTQKARTCHACEERSYHFDEAVCIARYTGTFRKLILSAKDGNREHIGRMLGRLAATQLSPAFSDWKPDIVVPVPMHWKRRFVRGVNSPELIAKALAKTLGVPIKHLVRRNRHTEHQFELPRKDRFPNVRDAFQLRKLFDVKGKKIVLVDDILTTGATCSETARLLKLNGAEAIRVAVLARSWSNLT